MIHRRTVLAMLALSSALATCCGNERECEPATVWPIDPERSCVREPREAQALQTCRSETEKGVAFECVASPDGDLYVAARNIAASFEGRSWRHGNRLSSSERGICEDVLESDYPGTPCESGAAGMAGAGPGP